MTTFTTGLYFLYPENRDFVAGKTRNLAGELSYYRTVFPWLIVMLVFCGGISMTRRWINWYQLQSAGVDTMATIVDRRYTENDDSKKYYITYQFEVVQTGSNDTFRIGIRTWYLEKIAGNLLSTAPWPLDRR